MRNLFLTVIAVANFVALVLAIFAVMGLFELIVGFPESALSPAIPLTLLAMVVVPQCLIRCLERFTPAAT